MMQMSSTAEPLLIAHEYRISDGIALRVPTIAEVLCGGEQYYATASLLIATPFDMMAQLDDIGVDFTKITDFELFWFVFLAMSPEQAGQLFVDLHPSDFKLTGNAENGEPILFNETTGVRIDQYTAELIADAVRVIMCVEKNTKKAGNGAAKKFLLQRARRRREKIAKTGKLRYLEPLIIAMVNAPEFKYDYQSCMNLNVYAFNASVQQTQKRINYNQVMSAVYAGTIKTDSLDMKKLNWLS